METLLLIIATCLIILAIPALLKFLFGLLFLSLVLLIIIIACFIAILAIPSAIIGSIFGSKRWNMLRLGCSVFHNDCDMEDNCFDEDDNELDIS